jgi:hypothetical protein
MKSETLFSSEVRSFAEDADPSCAMAALAERADGANARSADAASIAESGRRTITDEDALNDIEVS